MFLKKIKVKCSEIWELLKQEWHNAGDALITPGSDAKCEREIREILSKKKQ